MDVGTLISVEEYLKTSYSPDREYRDGVLVERNVGERAHALLQGAIAAYLQRRRREWKIQAYISLRGQEGPFREFCTLRRGVINLGITFGDS